MKFNRFFAVASLLASGGGLLAACSSESVDTPTGAGGIAGAGGSTGGKAGTGGSSAGAAGAATGGAGGSQGGAAGAATGGTAGEAGAAGAGGQCLGDEGSVTGGWGSLCDSLPYATVDCSGQDPLGEVLCRYMVDGATDAERRGRLGVLEPLFDCLAAISTGDACNDAGANACVDSVFPQACPVSSVTFPDGDGGTVTVTCADVAAACASDDVNEQTCIEGLSPFQPWAQQVILECYDALPLDSCATDRADFEACVFAL